MNKLNSIIHHRDRMRLFLLIGCLVPMQLFTQTPDALASASQHQVMIEFSFDAYAVPEKSPRGYRLYIDGNPACENQNAAEQTMTCTLEIEDGTYQFTLSALYSDLTESPQSPPFPFTIGAISLPGDVNADATVDVKDATLGLRTLVGSCQGTITASGDVDGDSKIGLPEILYSLRHQAPF